MYLTKEAILSMLGQLAGFTPGTTVAITFYLPLDLLVKEDQYLQQIAEKGAKQTGTPFISFFKPEEILALARKSGFSKAELISSGDLARRYFNDRQDHLTPASGEVFLLAKI